MQAVLAVTTAAARAMSETSQAKCRLVTTSLPILVACLTANHRELPASALSCLDALLGERAQSCHHEAWEGSFSAGHRPPARPVLFMCSACCQRALPGEACAPSGSGAACAPGS